MPVRDIVKEYREAKAPKKQIDILADLNHTKPCRIAWILDRCGETVDKTKLPRKSRNADAPDLDLIWRDTPIGAEAAQINAERKRRIMEEKAYIEHHAGEIPVVSDEIVAETEPAVTEVTEVTVAESEPLAKEVVAETVRPASDTPLAELITAEFWQIYLSHTFRPVNEVDVRAMLMLADVAKGLME